MQPVLIRVQEHGIFTEENCTHAVASKHEISTVDCIFSTSDTNIWFCPVELLTKVS